MVPVQLTHVLQPLRPLWPPPSGQLCPEEPSPAAAVTTGSSSFDSAQRPRREMQPLLDAHTVVSQRSELTAQPSKGPDSCTQGAGG